MAVPHLNEDIDHGRSLVITISIEGTTMDGVSPMIVLRYTQRRMQLNY